MSDCRWKVYDECNTITADPAFKAEQPLLTDSILLRRLLQTLLTLIDSPL